MTWLYVPGLPETSSPSALGSEDLNSASCSPSNIGEKLAEASATWRGKEQQPQVWSRRWKQGGFIRRLSGLTCSPSTLDHGVAQFISSLREIPARITASPESERERKALASSHPRSAASPKSAGLILSSERTCRGTRTDSLKPSSRHWSGWATALRQEYSARPPLATPCGASDCSSWPSASVMDTADGSDLEKVKARRTKHKARGINGNGFGESLSEKAQTITESWRGPSDLSKRGGSQTPEKRLAGGHSVNLEDQAEHWNPQWPSPMAGAPGTDVYNAAGNSDFSRKAMELADEMIKRWSSPKASDPEKAGPNMRGSKGDIPLPGQAANGQLQRRRTTRAAARAASPGRTASQGRTFSPIRPSSSSARRHPRPDR